MTKKKSDKPIPPKKPLSPFLRYRSQVFKQVQADHPGCRVTQLTTIIANMWNNIDEQTRRRVEQQYLDNKAIIDQQRKEYERLYGKIIRKKKIKKIKKKTI